MGELPEQTQEERDAIARGDVFEPGTVVAEGEGEPAGGEPAGEPSVGPGGDPPTDQGEKERGVTRDRFEAVLESNRALKAQLDALESRLSPAPAQVPEPEPAPATVEEMEARVEELEAQADELLLEGDLDKRKKVLREMRALNREIAKTEIREETAATVAVQSTAQVVKEAVAQYPFLDHKSDQGNSDAIDAIINYRNGLEVRGVSRPEALKRAVDALGPLYAARLGAASATSTQGIDSGKERDQAALKKAADASLRQPPQLPASKEKMEKIDVDKLSKKDLDAMPEDQKARLRGDVM